MSTPVLANSLNTLPSAPPKHPTTLLRNWLFGRIHGNKLIYNTCWEDPRCDRAMLDINPSSKMVMITSAGDNALAYMLDAPEAIHCVDVNLRQNALLHLKLSGLQFLDWPSFFTLFGEGKSEDFRRLYQEILRDSLPERSRIYWDRQQHYFTPKRRRAGLYWHGSSGYFAWAVGNLLRTNKTLFGDIERFFQSTSIEEQRERYFELEPKLLNILLGSKLRQTLGLNLLGVPEAQARLIDERPDGLRGYVRDSLRHIFTDLPVQDNYFYSLYFRGRYTKECCPDYLLETNFEHLSQHQGRIHTHTTSITNFLQKNPGQYTHFVLLDHLDWLANNDMAAMIEEWEQVLANSLPGTKILLRSACERPDVVPDFVRRRVRFRDDLSAPQAKLDRVGTYAGTFLLEVTH
jgi:S-adenosylmethionine-diacylglycerol 3-amino-3-carboxypropyl transferase